MWPPTWVTFACAGCRCSTATSAWSVSSRSAMWRWWKAAARPQMPLPTSRGQEGRIRRPRISDASGAEADLLTEHTLGSEAGGEGDSVDVAVFRPGALRLVVLI